MFSLSLSLSLSLYLSLSLFLSLSLLRLDSIQSQPPLDLEAAEKQCDEAVKEVHGSKHNNIDICTPKTHTYY